MYKINQSVELWPAPEKFTDQVARAARLCYASNGGKRTSEEMCDMLRSNGHKSMFRHGSVYVVAPRSAVSEQFPWIWVALSNTPYVTMRYCKRRKRGDEPKDRIYFLSTNVQFVMEHPWFLQCLGQFVMTEAAFAARAREESFLPALSLIRYTVCVTTQISTSRELNRTSPNNIAEQSTRYVNFFKRGGGITICLPHWYQNAKWYQKLAANISWKVSEVMYNFFCRFGMKPEDAREMLPLSTATRVAYTYNVLEWREILKLRMLGSTGTPHPNAQYAATLIHDVLLTAMRMYGGDEAKLLYDIIK